MRPFADVRRLAAIDLGTNTVRLLVVEVRGAGRWSVLYQTQAITRLGEGVNATGKLGEAPMARTIATVSEFRETANRLGAREILIVATSAVRDARNRQEFLERVHRATDLRVRVVPGQEEARLALLGTLYGLPALAGSLLLFDIGGGSTEFILARDRQVSAAVSLRLGVVGLAERYAAAEPVNPTRHAEMDRKIRGQLRSGLAELNSSLRPDHLVGTAGTVTTLAALDLGLPTYDPARIHGHVLQRARIAELLARLAALPAVARAELPCLPPGRADVIVPGAVICLASMDHFGFQSLIVSESGLREGILVQHLFRPQP